VGVVLKKIALNLTIVIVTMAALTGFLILEDALLKPCNSYPSCQAFSAYEKRDPLCIIDPTCISPFYKTPQSGSVPHWQGVVFLGETNSYGNGRHLLALPNYLAFMVVGISLVILTLKYLHQPRARHLTLLAIFTWCACEIIVWFGYLSSLDPTTPWVNPEAVATLLGSLSLLSLTTYAARKWLVAPR
jgi:hypothetical protein